MKLRTLLLSLALIAAVPLAPIGCASAPSSRVVQVQTLKVVGESADAAVALSARLYDSKAITPAQARAVLDFYNTKFQPVYRVAVTAVKADLGSIASPELVGLAAQLVQLVAQLQSAKP